jgi:hypothetical protein
MNSGRAVQASGSSIGEQKLEQFTAACFVLTLADIDLRNSGGYQKVGCAGNCSLRESHQAFHSGVAFRKVAIWPSDNTNRYRRMCRSSVCLEEMIAINSMTRIPYTSKPAILQLVKPELSNMNYSSTHDWIPQKFVFLGPQIERYSTRDPAIPSVQSLSRLRDRCLV